MSEDIENQPAPPATSEGSPEAKTAVRPSPDERRARREQRAETVCTLAAQFGEQEQAALSVVVKAIGVNFEIP